MLIVTLVLFFVFVGTDTPRFYLSNGQEEKAKAVIKKIYNVGDSQQKLDNIYKAELAACDAGGGDEEQEGKGGAAEKLTAKQVLWTDERYARSS